MSDEFHPHNETLTSRINHLEAAFEREKEMVRHRIDSLKEADSEASEKAVSMEKVLKEILTSVQEQTSLLKGVYGQEGLVERVAKVEKNVASLMVKLTYAIGAWAVICLIAAVAFDLFKGKLVP